MATPTEQLQAMRHVGENWDGYGAAAPQVNSIDLAQAFMDLIEVMLRKSASKPCTLHVCPTRIGGILIDWEDLSAQHEVEINPDGSIGFLHLNKATGQTETRTFFPGPLVPGFFRELEQLFAA